MREHDIRAAVRSALAEVEHGIDTGAAWTTFLDQVGQPNTRRPRRWPMLTAGAAVVVAIGIAALAIGTRPSVRTTPDSPAPSSPGSAPADSTPAPTQAPPSTTAPTSAPPSAGATGTTGIAFDDSPFATAVAVAAGPSGIHLGLPDGDWQPTSFAEPATGPAYLAGKLVVQQNADPADPAVTSGPITVVSKDGVIDGTDFVGQSQLLDASLTHGRPVMLTTERLNDGANGSVYTIRLSDAQDLTPAWIAGPADDPLRTTPVVAGALGDDWAVVLRDPGGGSLTMQALALTPGDDTVTGTALPPGSWHLTVEGSTAWVFGVGNAADGARLDVNEFRLDSLALSSYSIDLPGPFDVAACRLMRFDGAALTCDDARFDVATSTWSSAEPAAEGALVTPRRGPLPADVPVDLEGFVPWVDPEICGPVAARSSGVRTVDDYIPFTASLQLDTYQFVGFPDLEWGGPFALVGVFTTPRWPPDEWPAPGEPPAIRFEADTAAAVSLPSRRQAYVRTWGFDRAMIEQLVGALTERPVDAAVPGFDYDPTLGPPGMQLLHEQLPGPMASAGGHRLLCEHEPPPAGYGRVTSQVYSLRGDDLYLYFAVLDRPYPSDVGRRGDSLIIVTTWLDEAARPAAADVVAAPVAEWVPLLDEPFR